MNHEKQKIWLWSSLSVNLILILVFAIKYHISWFEPVVLKEPFRNSLFNEQPNEQNKIYFIGDSHTEAFELAEMFNNPSVRNRGIWGDVTTGVIKRLDKIIKNRPEKVFIMIGVNDVCYNTSVKDIRSNVEQIIKKIKLGSPATKIFLQSILPTDHKIHHSEALTVEVIMKLNENYMQLSMDEGITYINLYPYFLEGNGLKKEYSFDGLHLNGKGYMKWKELIVEHVN